MRVLALFILAGAVVKAAESSKSNKQKKQTQPQKPIFSGNPPPNVFVSPAFEPVNANAIKGVNLDELSVALDLAQDFGWAEQLQKAIKKLDALDVQVDTPEDLQDVLLEHQQVINDLSKKREEVESNVTVHVKTTLAALDAADKELEAQPDEARKIQLETILEDVHAAHANILKDISIDMHEFTDKVLKMSQHSIVIAAGDDVELTLAKANINVKHLRRVWFAMFRQGLVSLRKFPRTKKLDAVRLMLTTAVDHSIKFVQLRKEAMRDFEKQMERIQHVLNGILAEGDFERYDKVARRYERVQQEFARWSEFTKSGTDEFIRKIFQFAKASGSTSIMPPSTPISLQRWEDALAKANRLLRLIEVNPDDTRSVRKQKAEKIRALVDDLQRARKVQLASLIEEFSGHFVRADWITLVVQIHPELNSVERNARLKTIELAADKYRLTRTFLMKSIQNAITEFRQAQAKKTQDILGDMPIFSVAVESMRSELMAKHANWEDALQNAQSIVNSMDRDAEISVRERDGRLLDFEAAKASLSSAYEQAKSDFTSGWEEVTEAYWYEYNRIKDNKEKQNQVRKVWTQLKNMQAKYVTSLKARYDFVLEMVVDSMEATRAATPEFEQIPNAVPPPFVQPQEPLTGAVLTQRACTGFAKEYEGQCQARFSFPIVIERQSALDLSAPVEKRQLAQAYITAKVKLLNLLRQRRKAMAGLGEFSGATDEGMKMLQSLDSIEQLIKEIGPTCV